MNIGQLKRLIASLPDTMLVVVGGSDHSYLEATAGTTKAEIHRNKRGYISHIGEYYDEGHRLGLEGSAVEEVLAVGAG